MADDLIEAIVAAADDSYEVYAQQLENQKDPDWLGVSAIVTAPIIERQPFKDAIAAVEASPELAKYLEVPAGATQAFLYANGHQTLIATGMSIVAHLLNHAAIETYWAPHPFNKDAFRDNCRTLAATLVAWSTDNSVKFTALQAVGIYNVFLRPDAEIQTPWGTLLAAPRRPHPPQVFTNGLDVLRISVRTTGDGPALDQRDRPSAYLLQREEVTLTTKELTTEESPFPFAKQRADVVAEKLAFAIVLAVGDTVSLDAPVFGGSCTSMPISSGSGGVSVPTSAHQGLRVIQAQEPEAEAAIENYSNLVALAPDPILFAGRRLLRAINSSSAEDALVDSVVVWETIFGASPETTFRVTAAVTKTLFPLFSDDVTEMELQKWLARIYRLRSAVVHGNPAGIDKDPAKLRGDMLNARRWARLLLLEAFKWPIEVLNDTSGSRSTRVMLDPDWPNPKKSCRTL